MDMDLTFDMLVDFPNQVIAKTQKYGDYLDLLSKEEIEKHDYDKALHEIKKCITRFKDAKFIYNFPVENSVKVTSTYDKTVISPIKTISDSIGDLVCNYIDNQIWVKRTYDKLLSIAPRLNRHEAIYFVDYFFKNYSEQKISEKLGMDRKTLRTTVKKSCIIKLWIELEPFICENVN